jgi:uncharacterized membrane protein (GlpM family)
MSLSLALKAFLGFVIVLLVQLFARSKHYYVAALVPLFPSLGIFSYYFVGDEQGPRKLQETILFGMVSLLTYFSFLLALLIGIRHFRVVTSLLVASATWFAVAAAQIKAWPWIKGMLRL